MMKLPAFILFFLSAIIGWSQHCIDDRYSETALFDSAQIVIDGNIEYGVATHFLTGQPVSLVMDVYYPDVSVDPLATRPLIVSIHGGGFIGGDKAELAYQSMEFARRGFVVANINYRVGWGCDNVLCINCFATQMQKAIYSAVQDARAALRYMSGNASQYHIDTDWIFVSGESAGSITGMLATFWNQQEADAQVADGFSLTAEGLDESGNDLPAGYVVRGIINQCGAIPELSDMDNNADVPVIGFHDSNDCVVPYNTGALIACFCNGFLSYRGSNTIHSYRLNNGMCSELHTAPQVLPNHCTYPDLPLVKLSSCFLKRIMCGFCMNFADDDIYATPICSDLGNTDIDILGCTYPTAVNYDPSANQDDGSCSWENPTACPADADGDGIIGISDLLVFLGAFGTTCP